MKKIILYDFYPAWAGGFILSPPVCFPTQLFKNEGIVFEYFDPTKVYTDNDIIYANWGHYFLMDLKEKFKNNLMIVGGPEPFADQWKQEYEKSTGNTLFLFGDGSHEKLTNTVFIEKFWWLTSFFSHADADYNPKYGLLNRTCEKKFLMQIRSIDNRTWRLEVYGALIDHIDQSYVSRVDLNMSLDALQATDTYDLYRLMKVDPMWFSNSHFTVILETYIDSDHPIFITEKTFKPIAFGHPFLLVSSPGSLNSLKQWGFESFENIFDESYDEIIYEGRNFKDKLKVIKRNVDTYNYKEPYSLETVRKIEHNRNLFFNKEKVQNFYKDEVVGPVVDWVHSK